MKSKFYKKVPLKDRTSNFFQSLLFWKGRKKGMIHTRNITLEDLRVVFFPKTFEEKYSYLGYIPWCEEDDLFRALKPLVLKLDEKAKPKYCPRFVLRFLDLFGNDKSIVRVRNFRLHNLFYRLTKGYRMMDYKTKWSAYDLRISVRGDREILDFAESIEREFFERGQRKEALVELMRMDQEDGMYNT